MVQSPVSDHYRSQAGLAVALSRIIASLWTSFDPHDMKSSVPALSEQIAALVRQFSLSSGSLAAREYERVRQASGVASRFTVPVADPPSVEQIDKSVTWAVSDLWGTVTPEQTKAAETRLEGAAERLVLNTARETTVQAVHSDRRARAWARETRPGCCSFCSMLALRGAVYKTAQSAGDEHAYHDHCHCQVVPVFSQYEPPAQVRQWQADWQQVTQGLGGNAARIAWRQHIENRAT